jgi:hypothetical protein
MATEGRNGGEKTGGRQKGTPNKLTKTVRETFAQVFGELQEDQNTNLKSFATKFPKEFHQIVSKLIPTELEHSGGLTFVGDPFKQIRDNSGIEEQKKD